MSAAQEYVGYTSTATAVFQQSGGMNTATTLTIGAGGQYLLTGGTLQVSGGLVNQGLFSGGSSPASSATLDAGGVLDFTAGLWQNLGEISLNMAANSLLVMPPGFNPTIDFGSYSSQGLVYTPGPRSPVPAGKGFTGTYTINDPVDCQGTITAANGLINLNNGLAVFGNAVVSLGGGNLRAAYGFGQRQRHPRQRQRRQRQPHGQRQRFRHHRRHNLHLQHLRGLQRHVQPSGKPAAPTRPRTISTSATTPATLARTPCSGGLLSAPTGYYSNATGSEYVGYSGTGTLTQSGGTNAVTSYLALGYNSGAKGAYNMIAGTAGPYLIAPGFYGTGAFNQSGGTVGAGYVEVAYAASTATGSYTLSGGSLQAGQEDVGDAGTGTFTQLGGTNSVNGTGSYNNCLNVGLGSAAHGTYNLAPARSWSARASTSAIRAWACSINPAEPTPSAAISTSATTRAAAAPSRSPSPPANCRRLTNTSATVPPPPRRWSKPAA